MVSRVLTSSRIAGSSSATRIMRGVSRSGGMTGSFFLETRVVEADGRVDGEVEGAQHLGGRSRLAHLALETGGVGLGGVHLAVGREGQDRHLLVGARRGAD